ncbi:unnamed protein product [Ostreobium quekettii]|uniref:Uncharacterized protein n=1 Tax=Ostreobium quekettii TaxID=121088 RepID=A0A8S1J2Z1_9CHLO|nr:unnamed protein product [Ostreobium quekettii]
MASHKWAWLQGVRDALGWQRGRLSSARGSARSIDSADIHGIGGWDSDEEDARGAAVEEGGGREDGVAGDEMFEIVDGRVPSLFEICARTIAQDKRLVARLYYDAPLGIEYLWEVVKNAQDRHEEHTRTKCTLNLRGCRDSCAVLGRTVTRRMTNCERLVSLILDDCSGLTDKVLRGVAIPRDKVALPHLQRISVADCPVITDNSLEHIIRIYGPKLKVVRLSNSGVSQRCVKAMALHCPNLEVAAFAHQLHIRDKHVVQLVMRCSRLKQIEAAYCRLITDVSVIAIAQKLWALESLDLSYCDQVGVSIEGLQQCKFLQGLRLQNCPKITDRILSPVLRWCNLLEVLCVRSCPLVTMSTVETIASHCESLRSLDITGIQADGNKALTLLAKSNALRLSLQVRRYSLSIHPS